MENEEGKTKLQEALDSWLACDSTTFEAFFKGLMRRSKRTLNSLNICDHVPYFCPGLVKISASRTNAAGSHTPLSLPLFSFLGFASFFLLQLTIPRFLTPLGSGLCLLAAPPLHPPELID